MELLAYGCLGFAVLNLFNSYAGGSKRDGRFKTGYKNNDAPKYVQFASRALVSGIFAIVGAFILWPKIVLGVMAALVSSYFLFPPVEKLVSEFIKSWK